MGIFIAHYLGEEQRFFEDLELFLLTGSLFILSKRKDEVSFDKWVIFIVICMVTMLDFGIIFSFGALLLGIMEEFETSRSLAVAVQTILIGVSLIFSIVSGFLITTFGLLKVSSIATLLVPLGFCTSFFVTEIKTLCITISFVSGIGISTIHLVSIVVIERFFPTRLHPICFAIQGISVNLAGIFYPILITNLLSRYGVHGTFLILGGLFLNGVLAPLVLRNARGSLKEFDKGRNSEETTNLREVDETVQQDNREDIADKNTNVCPISSLLTRPFLLLFLASVICIPPLNTFLALTLDIFVWNGISVHQGVYAFIVISVSGIVSKLLPILTKKIKKLSTFVLPVTYCGFGILSQVLVLSSSNYVIILIGMGCVGIALGGVFPAMLIVGVKLVDSKGWPLASGLLVAAVGLVSAFLGPIFGFMYELTGSYHHALVVILLSQILGLVLYTLAFVIRYKSKNPQGNLRV